MYWRSIVCRLYARIFITFLKTLFYIIHLIGQRDLHLETPCTAKIVYTIKLLKPEINCEIRSLGPFKWFYDKVYKWNRIFLVSQLLLSKETIFNHESVNYVQSFKQIPCIVQK